MSKKKIAPYVLSASLAINVMAVNANVDAKSIDVHESKYLDVIKKWQDKSYLKGYEDGEVLPEREITRAELISIINRIHKFTDMSDLIKNYKDVKSSDWFYKDMAIGLKEGYLKGVSSDELDPQGKVTQEQAIAFLMRIKKVPIEKNLDYKLETSDWARDTVYTAIKHGYVMVDEVEGSFNDNAKRANVVLWADRIMEDVSASSVKKNKDLKKDEKKNKTSSGSNSIPVRESKRSRSYFNYSKSNEEFRPMEKEGSKKKKEIPGEKPKGNEKERPQEDKKKPQEDKKKPQEDKKKPQEDKKKPEDSKFKLLSLDELRKLDERTYKDGVYHGDAFGMRHDKPISLKVTVENGKIKSVEIDEDEINRVKPKADESVVDNKGYTNRCRDIINYMLREKNYESLKYRLKAPYKIIDEINKEIAGKEATLDNYNQAFKKVLGQDQFGRANRKLTNLKADGFIARLDDLFRTHIAEDKNYGDYPDVISSATMTARGTVSAIENALRKSQDDIDIVDFRIVDDYKTDYKDMEELDLTKLKVKLTKKDGKGTKEVIVPFEDFEKESLVLLDSKNKPFEGKMTLDLSKMKKGALQDDRTFKVVHKKSNTTKLLKKIIVRKDISYVIPQKIQYKLPDENQWHDTIGFVEGEFIQALYIDKNDEARIKGKETEFRLLGQDKANKEIAFGFKDKFIPKLDSITAHQSDLKEEDVRKAENLVQMKNYRIYLRPIDNFEKDKMVADIYGEKINPVPVQEGENISISKIKKLIAISDTGNSFYDAKLEIVKKADTSKAGMKEMEVKLTFSDGSEKTIKIPLEIKEKEKETKAAKYNARKEERAALEVTVRNKNFDKILNDKEDPASLEAIKKILKLERFKDLGDIEIQYESLADLSHVGAKTSFVKLKFDDGSFANESVYYNVNPYEVKKLEVNTESMKKTYKHDEVLDIEKLQATVEVGDQEVTVAYQDFKDFGISLIKSNGKDVGENPRIVGDLIRKSNDDNKHLVDLNLKYSFKGEEKKIPVNDLIVEEENLGTKAEEFKKLVKFDNLEPIDLIVAPDKYKDYEIVKEGGLTRDKVFQALNLDSYKNKFGFIDVSLAEDVNDGIDRSEVKEGLTVQAELRFNDGSKCQVDLKARVVPIPLIHLSRAYSLNNADKDKLDLSSHRLMLSYASPGLDPSQGGAALVSYPDYKYFGIKVVDKNGSEFVNNSKIDESSLEDGKLILKVKVDKILNPSSEAKSEIEFNVTFKN